MKGWAYICAHSWASNGNSGVLPLGLILLKAAPCKALCSPVQSDFLVNNREQHQMYWDQCVREPWRPFEFGLAVAITVCHMCAVHGLRRTTDASRTVYSTCTVWSRSDLTCRPFICSTASATRACQCLRSSWAGIRKGLAPAHSRASPAEADAQVAVAAQQNSSRITYRRSGPECFQSAAMFCAQEFAMHRHPNHIADRSVGHNSVVTAGQ